MGHSYHQCDCWQPFFDSCQRCQSSRQKHRQRWSVNPKSLLETLAMLLTQQITSVVIQSKRYQLANLVHCSAVFPVATFLYEFLAVHHCLLQKSLLKLTTWSSQEEQQVVLRCKLLRVAAGGARKVVRHCIILFIFLEFFFCF